MLPKLQVSLTPITYLTCFTKPVISDTNIFSLHMAFSVDSSVGILKILRNSLISFHAYKSRVCNLENIYSNSILSGT